MSYPLAMDVIEPFPVFSGREGSPPDDARWRQELRDVVAQHIVPSLQARQRQSARQAISARVVTTLTTLLLSAPLAAVMALVNGLCADGVAIDDILLHLLAPAARRLGDLWQADQASFLDVTRGSMVIQAMVRQLGPAFEGSAPAQPHGRAILLTGVPGEQHVLGLCMLTTFFRRAGWHVALETRADKAALRTRLEAEPFDVVGLSASSARSLAYLSDLAGEVRRWALRSELRVIAGGGLVSESHGDGAIPNVDGIAHDAEAAVALANGFRVAIGP